MPSFQMTVLFWVVVQDRPTGRAVFLRILAAIDHYKLLMWQPAAQKISEHRGIMDARARKPEMMLVSAKLFLSVKHRLKGSKSAC